MQGSANFSCKEPYSKHFRRPSPLLTSVSIALGDAQVDGYGSVLRNLFTKTGGGTGSGWGL